MRGPLDSALGFTLIETMITTVVLVSGLVGVASLFSYSIAANFNSQQRTVAGLLLRDKVEQFRAAPSNHSNWSPGGSLDAASPIAGYFDYVTIGSDGSFSISTADGDARFMRLWKIEARTPARITICILGRGAGSGRRRIELIRGTTLAGARF